MYELIETLEFNASHKVTLSAEYESKLHTHLWFVRVYITFRNVDEFGVSVPFNEMHDKLKSLIKHFDKKYLNELPEFADLDPTAETTAKVIYEYLKSHINNENNTLRRIELRVTDSRVICYYEEEK